MTHAIDLFHWMYKQSRDNPYWGYIDFLTPTLLIRDPHLIHTVLVKDFDNFTDRRGGALSKRLKLSLITMKGDQWRSTRKVMSPTFSSGKLRGLHNLCMESSNNLMDYILRKMNESEAEELDMKDAFGRFTMDNIALCAFGVRCNSFEDPENTFANNASMLLKLPSGYGRARLMLLFLLPRWLVHQLPDPYAPAIEFFRRIIEETIEQRKLYPNEKHSDYLGLLLEACDVNRKPLLSNESIMCQAVLFLFAGYDTTANLLMYSSYCLSENQECQQRAREEVKLVIERNGGELTYQAISELKYLDQILNETLRLYPVVARLDRVCTKPYTMPDSSGLILEKGMIITVPVLELHRDPELYPEPMKFKPERFDSNSPGQDTRPYLGFGDGPRQCIAKRFAIFEAKVALAMVLQKFELKRSKNTPSDPIELSRDSILLIPKYGTMPLKIRRLDQ